MMNTKKTTIGNKISIFVALIICFAGIIISIYIPANIYNQAATLAHTPVSLNMTLLKLSYNFIAGIVLIVVIVNFCISMKKKLLNRVSLIHLFAMFIALFSLLYLPIISKPWNYYQFSGFVEGVKKDVDEDKLRKWIEQTVSNFESTNGKTFARGELNFLSRNEMFECETVVEITGNRRYNIIMYWGAPIGQYGLYVGTDNEKFEYIQSHYDVVEVFDDIYAWTSK